MAKKACMWLGVIIILVGLAGFFGGFGLVGATGIFVTGKGLESLYILLGLILILNSRGSNRGAASALKLVGIVYVLAALIGFVSTPLFGMITSNGADNWLHLILGIVIFLFGYYGAKNTLAVPASEPLL